MAIEELDLCKLIANELANHGPHDEQEVYGMLILLLRLHDGRQSKVANTTQHEIKRVEVAAPVQHTNNIQPPTKMPAQDRDALHIRILDILEAGPLTTRQVCTRLGIAIDDVAQRNKIGAHMRWLQRNGYITDVYINDKTKRNALWRIHGAK